MSMGVTERKEREKLELKDQILEAAKTILLESGKEGLSIRKIAAIIEYSPATIYLYYEDKDAILHDLMERGFEQMQKYMQEGYQESDPGKSIFLIGQAYVRFGLEQRDWYDLMFNSARPMKHMERSKEEWDAGFKMFDSLVDLCRRFIESSKRDHLKPDILALQLWSSVHGLVNLAQTERLEIVRGGDVDNVIRETLESIYISIFVTTN
jgi:AcrR family transcriptional regulator